MRNHQSQQTSVGHVYSTFERVKLSKAMEEVHYDTRFSKSPARNSLCRCGSGKKFKHCCIRRKEAQHG